MSRMYNQLKTTRREQRVVNCPLGSVPEEGLTSIFALASKLHSYRHIYIIKTMYLGIYWQIIIQVNLNIIMCMLPDFCFCLQLTSVSVILLVLLAYFLFFFQDAAFHSHEYLWSD